MHRCAGSGPVVDGRCADRGAMAAQISEVTTRDAVGASWFTAASDGGTIAHVPLTTVVTHSGHADCELSHFLVFTSLPGRHRWLGGCQSRGNCQPQNLQNFMAGCCGGPLSRGVPSRGQAMT